MSKAKYESYCRILADESKRKDTEGCGACTGTAV